MSTNYSLSFLLKKPKNDKGQPRPVYMRITVDKERREISVGRDCERSRWNSAANRAKGTKEEVKTLNAYLDTLVQKVAEIHHTMVKNRTKVTADALKLKFLGHDVPQKMLLNVFSEHNSQMKSLIGNGFKPNTLKGYTTSISHISAYLKQELAVDDIEVRDIDHAFVAGYAFFLRSSLGCSEVSAAKYIKHFRKITKICIAHRWIENDPFAFYKNREKARPQFFRTKDELGRIESKKFGTARLEQVRDIFVFCCYTGLSYADVRKLRHSDIAKGVDGKLWILTSREKTETSSNIPLLAIPLQIIDRYRDYPPSAAKDLLLPVLSNQKMNSYLKEIAVLCGINKEITFHLSRHTFATTVTLANNVPIETVSKMLGHTDIKTTQHYAKLLDTRIAHDMAQLDEKLNS